MIKRIVIGIIPVILGGLIYLTYRTDSLVMFGWFNEIGLSDKIGLLRSNYQLQNLTIPNWIKFSLPDALWLFSFTYITLIIWENKINRESVFWIFFAPMIGIFSEVGQLTGLIPGTFDKIDLILLIIATILPFKFLTKLKSIKIKNV
ncbi:hypothetical protein [Algoriphagus antarcticus]|uniref:Uncharacterized protein n=1 Tax=Algoriphagus antarcticus TaxID=238540 RepID=A0A3E0DUE8_9BACT|nr:hypothetical protein [Algoriphagus antarcticus]REG88254.1 hypothetical protein C8N25_11032 [Algoriphagus antarcticus]